MLRTGRPSGRAQAAGVVLALITACAGVERAAAAEPALAARTAPRAAAEQGIRWHEMRPAQQLALKPLEHEWPGMEAQRKRKWLELSTRFPKMPPAEQARVQERMGEWARLTPQERGNARLHFQQVKQMPLAERQARWDAYQALTPEQKQEFAARAGRPSALPSAGSRQPSPIASGARDVSTAANKPALPGTGPRVIGPTLVQARPGVTTTSITKRPTPPSHQQAGAPTIAATPEFVNRSTLLPRRGPQGPALPAAPSAEPAVPALSAPRQ